MGIFQDDCGSKRRIFPGGDCAGCGDERRLWDSVASEPNRLAGTPMKFYSIRRAKNRDPLYKEPSAEGKEWSYEGPFEVMGSVDFPQFEGSTVEATEVGYRKESEAEAYVARVDFERVESPYPKTGDIVEFWTEPPFNDPERETQWDVVKVSRDGNIFSSEKFVQYKISLRRRSKFFAFRKTEHTRA